jgi:hypothetical protein
LCERVLKGGRKRKRGRDELINVNKGICAEDFQVGC